ncbi:MAG: ABC transporter permease [Lachnospiraceae bacterium]|nr:ABC transporter permease [Lachnospiraceae bacterium]
MSEFDKTQIEFREDDFVLVQRDTKISDKKLETKPTTFFKDALRRFAKNKSSVVGGIILGILVLLSIFVPIVVKDDIENVKSQERFLAPKLFAAGTGFWDGTRSRKHTVYDQENEVPALSDKYSVAAVKRSLVSIKVDDEVALIDTANVYGHGGYIVIATDTQIDGNDIYMQSKPVAFTSNGDYKLDIVFSDEENFNAGKLGEYRVYLKTGENPEDIIVIRDFGKDYSDLSFDISAALKEAGLNSVNANIVFDVKASASEIRYVLVKSIKLTANENVNNAEMLEAVSFEDATVMINNGDKESDGYWACTGRKGIHNSEIKYCDYVIDTYMLVYGDADLVTYSATEVKNWIDNGWCQYDYTVGPESFVRLTNDCPVDVVESQQLLSRTKKLASITGRGWNYRKLGYDKMPIHLMGTDASGIDLLKRAFAGLRTSLLMGIIVAAVTFTFGLVWGSISGYFGGNIDIAMERFTDILGNIPGMVVLTLCILHFGNNFGTFVLALCMTGWIGTSHTTRTQFYRFKGREYVLASRTLGASDWRLIFKHILPNSMGTIITNSVFMITSVIYSEASLAYLNLGLQGTHSFGVMMSNNQPYLGVYAYMVIFPAVIMALMMISFNLFGNGLRDAFNPSLKGSE